jgi:hypothetical protein
MFSYSLILPPEKGSKENLQKAVQRDLETYFGFHASIESRKFRFWRLVATDSAAAKLATKGNKRGYEEIIPRVIVKNSNVPMNHLVNYCLMYTNGELIVDETGIKQNIDFTADMMDFDGMVKCLAKYGLKLIPSEREMKSLVIRDPKN